MSYRPPADADALAAKARERERLVAHRGLATWGERLVPIGDFRAAVAAAGRPLPEPERAAAREAFLARPLDPTPVEGPYSRIAVFGGVYSSSWALAAVLAEAMRAGAEAVYCLGDLGGFGPHPERCWPLLVEGGVRCIQGNYEASLASGADDCNCGYTDPRDNHFARLSYQYTARGCSPEFKAWMGALPARRRVRVGGRELLLVHGSPRRVNEFLFASTCPLPFLETVCEQERCDGFLCTHSGLPWVQTLPSGRVAANVGVIGRPANDGDVRVRWALVSAAAEGGVAVDVRLLAYDHHGLAAAMRDEELPGEFVDTVLTGWWTTCLEILPARERAASRF
jgi:hypothetical protein